MSKRFAIRQGPKNEDLLTVNLLKNSPPLQGSDYAIQHSVPAPPPSPWEMERDLDYVHNRLDLLTHMYMDFQGPAGQQLSPKAFENFILFLETQLLQATMTMAHRYGLRTPEERETIVSMYVEAVEMAFQQDESFEEEDEE